MRWNFVAQVALFGWFNSSYLLTQSLDLEHQQVDLLLLAENCAVKFIDHVFSKTDLDF